MARNALEAVFGALGGGLVGYGRDKQIRYGQEQDAIDREENRLARELAARQSAEQRKISLFQSGLEEAAPLNERAQNMGQASQLAQALSAVPASVGMPATVIASAVQRALSNASSGMTSDLSRGRKLTVDGTDYVQPFSRTPDGRAERERMQGASDARVKAMQQAERDRAQGERQIRAIRVQGEEARRTNNEKPAPTPGDRLTTATVRAMAQGAAQLDLISEARKAISEYPEAVGMRRGIGIIPNLERVGDVVNQNVDPRGNLARQLISNLASMEIRDRSGAAVTASEFPRLAPFIPNVYDTPEKVLLNLDGLERELLITLNALSQGATLKDVAQGATPSGSASEMSVAPDSTSSSGTDEREAFRAWAQQNPPSENEDDADYVARFRQSLGRGGR